MIIKIVSVILSENTYLIGDEDCYIVDPGRGFKNIARKVQENFKNVKGILLTHGHFDHVGSVDELVNLYHCPVYISNHDLCFVNGDKEAKKHMGSMSVEIKSDIKDINELKDQNIIVYETPGHSKGSVCYLFKKEKALFTGDTLFKNSIGRTDLYSGSDRQILESLKIFKQIDPKTNVYPGHEQSTVLEDELKNNMYLRNI